MKHLRAVFENTKLADLTAEEIEMYFRRRLKQRVRGAANEWVTQLLRQGDAKVFKKDSQMTLEMKGEALARIHRHEDESGRLPAQGC